VSRVRISNASGASAIVTVDVILRPTAEDHASMRLTLAGEEVADDNPFPTVGAVVGDVDVVQAVASSLNATVTQAGTVQVASASTLDTRALTSATDSITAEPGAGSFSVAQPTASNLNATVTQAAVVAVEGQEMQVATILSPGNTAEYPIVGACRLYGVYFAHGSTNEQNLALYDATSGVVPATARKFSIMAAAGDLTMVVPGGGYISFANGVGIRSTTTENPTSTSSSSTDTMALLFYRLVV
jgi:pyrimidine deaminase RibD-like protein